MTPRDTSTGAVLENMVLPSLERGGYECESQIHVGKRISGGKHIADVVAEKNGSKYIVSLKWQQVSGTAEQKVPFEVLCLLETVLDEEKDFDKAYLVLGGDGWSLREFYVGGGLESYLQHADKVDIMTLETFVAVANNGEL